MNKQRRKAITKVVNTLSALEGLKDILQYCTILDSVDEPLQEIIDEEQEALDNMPDSLLFSMRYDDMQNGLLDLEGAQIDLALASERIATRGKFHGSDTRTIRKAITTLQRLSR